MALLYTMEEVDAYITANALPIPSTQVRLAIAWTLDKYKFIDSTAVENLLGIQTAPPEKAVTEEGVPIPPREVVTVTETPALPWYAAWLGPVMDWISSVGEWLAKVGVAIAQPFMPVAEFFKDPMGVITKGLTGVFKKSVDESVASALKTASEVTSHTPEWKKDLDTTLTPFAQTQIEGFLKKLSPETIGKSPLTPEEAAIAAAGVATTVTGTSIALWLAHAAAQAASLGQYKALRDMDDMVIAKLGLGALGAKAIDIPLEHLVWKRTHQFYAHAFTPEIPPYSDLINMVVKEKITIDEFKSAMKYQGFSERYSQLIWDAHFIAPSLGQILTSFRRGHIDADTVKRLQILVDLDPIYNGIWFDQWYNDPSVSEARFMFETGAIDEKAVKDIVVRSGLDPLYVDRFTDFIVRFQERLWRRRTLLTIAMGYRRGVYDEARLRSEVAASGYSSGVADWIKRNEDLKKEIAETVRRPEKYRLITVSFAEDLYEHGDVDEGWMREYFADKGYDAEDVDLSMKVFNRKKEEYLAKEVAG